MWLYVLFFCSIFLFTNVENILNLKKMLKSFLKWTCCNFYVTYENWRRMKMKFILYKEKIATPDIDLMSYKNQYDRHYYLESFSKSPTFQEINI